MILSNMAYIDDAEGLMALFDSVENEELNSVQLNEDTFNAIVQPQAADPEDSDVSDVDEQIIDQNYESGSDSEESAVSDNEDGQLGPQAPYYVGRDGETTWSYVQVKKTTQSRACNIVTKLPGPILNAKNAKTELDCFKLFFPNEMIDTIVKIQI